MTKLPSRLLASACLLASGLLACATTPDPRPLHLAEDLRLADSPDLAASLAARDPVLRERAIVALGRIQAAGSASALAAQAGAGESKPVRLAALFALGQLGLVEGAKPPAVAVEAARQAAAEADPEIVAAAVEALGKLAAPGAEADLIPFLRHAAAPVREQAAYASFRLRFVPAWRKETEKPPELSDAALAALATAGKDPAVEVRRAAVYASARFGEPRAIPMLLPALADADELTRLFAARALGKSGATVPAERLVPLLADPSAAVRAEALLALLALGQGELAPATMEKDASFQVRAAFARALAGGKDAAGIEPLRRLASDPSPTVQAAAIGSLALRLHEGYRGELEAALANPSWVLRVAAVHGLGLLGEASLPLLEHALASPDPRVATAAVEELSALPGAEVDALLLRALGADDLAVRGAAVGALNGRPGIDLPARLAEAYAASSGEAWIEVREGIVDSLGGFFPGPGREASQKVLEGIARQDPAPSVRSRARLALARWGVPQPAAEATPAPTASPFLDTRFARDPVIVMETSRGTLRIRCFAADAPIHVANFVHLVRSGYYDSLLWHRVVPNFVIQGGDPRGDGSGGPGYTLRDEINRHRFVRGTVGMPKAGKDTGGGQLFVTHLPTPHLDGNYTVFGQVISGLEVIDEIEVGDQIVRAYIEK